MAWSHSGELVVVATALGVDVVDPFTTTLLCHFDSTQFDWHSAIAFGSDDKEIVVQGDDTATIILDAHTCKKRGTIDFSAKAYGDSTLIRPYVFSDDGTNLIFGPCGGFYGPNEKNPHKLWLGSTRTGSVKFIAQNAQSQICYEHVALSRDSTLLAGGGDLVFLDFTLLQVWDIKNSSVIWQTKTHKKTNGISGVEFSPDSNFLASVGADGNLNLWNSRTGEIIYSKNYGDDYLGTLTYSPDGKVIALGTYSSGIRIVNSSTGEQISTLVSSTLQVEELAFSEDGNYLASDSLDKGLQMWDWQNNHLLSSFPYYFHRQGSLSISPDSKLIAASGLDYSKILEIETGTLTKILDGQEYAMFNIDGTMLASISTDDRSLSIWTVPGFDLVVSGTVPVAGFAFHPDGSLIAVAPVGGQIQLLTIKDLSEEFRFKGGRRSYYDLAFSPDGAWLTSHFWDDLKIWRVRDGVLWQSLKNEVDYAGRPVFTPDSQFILWTMGKSTELKSPTLIRPSDGSIVSSLVISQNYWFSDEIAISPDGTIAAIQVFDASQRPGQHEIQLWSMNTPQILATLRCDCYTYSLKFADDGKLLLLVAQDGTIRIYGIDPRE